MALAKSTKVFLSRPTPSFIENFKSHVKETGPPETFHGLDHSRPVSHDGAEILAKFGIDRLKRPDRDCAPCPICSPNDPKFLEGCLVWYPKDQAIRAIGRECSAKIDANWHRRQRQFKLREEEEATAEFLFNNLHEAPFSISELKKQIDAAILHRKIWGEFRKRCPEICQDLRTAMKSGTLVARRSRDKSLNGVVRGDKYFNENIGAVRGQTAVKSNFTHHTKFKEHLRALQLIELGADKEETGLAVCEMSVPEMKTVEKAIKRGRRAITELTRLNSDFEGFFAEGNLRRINKWASYLPPDSRFTLEVSRNGSTLIARSVYSSFEPISLKQLKQSSPLKISPPD